MRTPLTVLRLDAEGLASEEDRLCIVKDVDRLEQIVTRVIRQSRRSSRQERGGDHRGTCDLGQVIHHRMAFWSILATRQGRQWSVDVPGHPQPIAVSRGDLEVCLDALLNNVLVNTPGGSPFSVEVVAGSGSDWTLIVQDAGPGLPGKALPARGATGGSGTGLGLDIVRQMAEASGGRLSAGRSPGGGARIEVCFGAPAERS